MLLHNEKLTDALLHADGTKTALSSLKIGRLCYNDLIVMTNTLSSELERAGVHTGDRVAAIFQRGPDSWAAFLGISVHGACVPMPSWTPDQMIIDRCKALDVSAVVTSPQFADIMRIILPPTIAILTLSLNDLSVEVIRDRKLSRPAINSANNIALVVSTSGSTGAPKHVPLTHRNILSAASSIAEYFALCSSDSCGNLMPFFHVHGLISAGVSTLVSGGELVVLDGVNPKEIHREKLLEKVTWITGVPALYHGLLDAADRVEKKYNNPRFIRVASAALDPELRKRLDSSFECRVVESYGLSETSSLITSQDPKIENCIGSGVGFPVGAEIKVFDEAQNECPNDALGRVAVRGNSVCRAYWDGAECFLKDGWFDTGDTGFFVDDGSLIITGRTKHMINRAGETIPPKDIENACIANIQCKSAIAWGEAHPVLGEIPVAAIEGEHQFLLTAPEEIRIRTLLLKQLPTSYMPAAIFSISTIPCNDVGKLDLKKTIDMVHRDSLYHIAMFDKTDARNSDEETLQNLYFKAVGKSLGIRANFHLLTEDISKLRIWMEYIRETTKLKTLSIADLYKATTIHSLSVFLSSRRI